MRGKHARANAQEELPWSRTKARQANWPSAGLNEGLRGGLAKSSGVGRLNERLRGGLAKRSAVSSEARRHQCAFAALRA